MGGWDLKRLWLPAVNPKPPEIPHCVLCTAGSVLGGGALWPMGTAAPPLPPHPSYPPLYTPPFMLQLILGCNNCTELLWGAKRSTGGGSAPIALHCVPLGPPIGSSCGGGMRRGRSAALLHFHHFWGFFFFIYIYGVFFFLFCVCVLIYSNSRRVIYFHKVY